MAKADPNYDAEMELSPEELDELVLDIPVSQRRLITSSADFSVDTLVSMLRDQSLVIPLFQRKYIWSEKKASRLIESLIMQCPIPVIYLNRRDDEVLEVVDGNQRVTSLKAFVDGRFRLSGLTAYPELVNQSFDTMDTKLRRQIKNRTIRCVIIEPESNPKIKFDVFERLNSGSTPLSPQELRHGLYYGPYVEMLASLAANPKLIAMSGTKNDQRMKGDELVLRFFAFSEALGSYQKPLSAFLSNYLAAQRGLVDSALDSKKRFFLHKLNGVSALLGPSAFRLKSSDNSSKKFNTAFYDAITVGYATSNLFALTNFSAIDSVKVQEAVDQVTESAEFKASTLRATSDKQSIDVRIGLMRQLFDSFA